MRYQLVGPSDGNSMNYCLFTYMSMVMETVHCKFRRYTGAFSFGVWGRSGKTKRFGDWYATISDVPTDRI